MALNPVVRAIDVGYGNTKYVVAHTKGQPITCSLFPSVAPQANAIGDLGNGVFQRRNTVTLDIGGVRYEVGKDAELAQDASFGRVLDVDYSMSDTYMALLRGALYYMGEPTIDMLVLGLPVNLHDQFADKLMARALGKHKVPAFDAEDPSSAPQVTVEVKAVRVIPQPIGAFLDYSIRTKAYNRMRNEMNLLIDPGYFTLDWVVSKGVKMINARSGAHSGGMSSLLRAMAEQISHRIGSPITDLSLIDSAIREHRNPHFFGKEFTEFPEFLATGKEKARQFVSVMANKVGTGVDIQNIVVAGGGAEFFLDVVQEKFPRHELVICDDPIYSNVRGFQLAGTQFMGQEEFTHARAGAA